MQEGDLIFVYGTLRRGEGADLSKKAPECSFVGVDQINGQIYDVGWFPGLKPLSPDLEFQDALPTVIGDVFEVKGENTVDKLDSYEGYPSLYDRREFETETGKTVWAYVYNPPIHADALVVTGDWKDKGDF